MKKTLMKKSNYLLLLVAFVVTVNISFAQNKSQPNIIVILSDDHAYQAISAYNDRLAQIAPTPNIDQLANEGIRFDRSYVGNSICAPSRATLLTGTHSHINGILTLKEHFNGEQPTIANILQKVGYETSIIGKWHLKSEPVGFSYWDILMDQGDYYNSDFKTTKGITQNKGYVTDVITNKAINWLETIRKKESPFMMIVGNKAAHSNWIPPIKYLTAFDDISIPEPANLLDNYSGRGTAAKEANMQVGKMPMGWYCQLWTQPKSKKNRYEDYGGKLWDRAYGRLDAEQKAAMDNAYDAKNEAFLKAHLTGDDLVRWKYQRILKNYLACVKSIDDNVGRLMEYLKTSGLDQNTIVIYVSDQGLFLGEHGWYDKRLMYEEAVRTPLIAYCPALIPAAQVNLQLVQNIDYAPTILDFAGVDIPETFQGESLKNMMQGEKVKQWRKSLYYHYYDHPSGSNIQKHEGVITKRYKLIHFYELNEWEFYDLKNDPTEMKSEYENKRYQKKITELKNELISLRKTYKVPEI